MADRIVVDYVGDRGSLPETVRAARGVAVVAVAFDCGGTTPLTALRGDALTLGAVRSHALALKEDLARDAIVPALDAGHVNVISRLVTS